MQKSNQRDTLRDKRSVPMAPAAIGILACLLAFVFTLESIHFPLSMRTDYSDSGIYQYIGHLLAIGKTPYVDAFDHKGIIFYAINMIGVLISPKFGMWILEFIFMLADALLVYKLARRFADRTVSVIACVIIISGLGSSFWIGNTPDFFAVTFCLAAFYFLSDELNNKRLSFINVFLSGISTAIAFWMKPDMLVGTGALCLAILVLNIFKRNFSYCGKSVAAFLAGFAAVTIPVIIWFISRNALSEMIQDYFLFNFSYSAYHMTWSERLDAYVFFLTHPTVFLCILAILAYLISFIAVKDRTPEIKTMDISMVCSIFIFIVSSVMCILPGNRYEQYGYLLYPSVLLIMIFTVNVYLSSETVKKKFLYTGLAAAGAVVFLLNLQKEITCIQSYWKENAEETAIEEYIVDNVDNDETIAAVTPRLTGLYLKTGRESATPNIYIQAQHFADFEDDPAAFDEFWNLYIDQLSGSMPQLIIFDKSYEGSNAALEKLSGFLEESYIHAGESKHLDVYYRNDGSTGVPEFEYIGSSNSTELGTTRITDELKEKYENGELSEEEIADMLLSDLS